MTENLDVGAQSHRRAPRAAQNLMVISDDAPVDDSTLSVNAGKLSRAPPAPCDRGNRGEVDVEMTAIGIGHDVRAITAKRSPSSTRNSWVAHDPNN